MQRKIGEVFTTKEGVTLEVQQEILGCVGCYFYMNGCYQRDVKITGGCNNVLFVIFVEVEPEKE